MMQVKVEVNGVQVAIVNVTNIGWELDHDGFGFYSIKGYEFRDEDNFHDDSIREYTAEKQLLRVRNNELVPALEFVRSVLAELVGT